MIKTVFFDIGGVLIDIHPSRTFQYISDCLQINKSIVEKSFPHSAHNDYEKGKMSNSDWFLNYRNSLPQPCFLEEIDFWKAWKLLLGKEKKTVELIKSLKNNYSVWLLSNTNPKHIRDEIENKYEFPKLIDGAVYSFEVGLRKPDMNIYKIAAEMASVEPNESVFVDDLIENITSSKKIGMNSIHFTTFEKLKKDFKILGVERS